MPRPPRIDFPGAKHHIMNRSGGGRLLFNCDRDRILFLQILSELPTRYALDISSYALMNSHYHLRVTSKKGLISPAMGYLQSQYSRRVNYSMGLNGGLFRSRFKSKLVTREDHWVYLIAYLHLNPVKARMAMSVDRYEWTSHFSYINPARKLPWLSVDLSPFGTENDYLKFVTEVRCGARRMPEEFEKILFDSPSSIVYTGPNETVKATRIIEVLEKVASVVGSSPKNLKQTVRGRNGNPGRVLALYWLVTELGITISEAGRCLKIGRSSASEIYNKFRQGSYRRNEQLTKFHEQLIEIFNK